MEIVTRRSRQPFRCAIVVLALAACGPADSDHEAPSITDEVPEAGRYGGTAVVGIPIDMPTMNPLDLAQLYSAVVARNLLFLPLVKNEPSGEVTPWLAARWDTVRVAPDTLALTFHLRRDVKWHDGVPTTAEDVRFTYERMRDPRTAYEASSTYRHWDPRAEVLDSFAVRFRLRTHAGFLDLPISALPKHLLQAVPPEEMRYHASVNGQPVGNGPFRFVRRVPGQEWVFEANPDFPRALGGRPYLDRIVFRVMPDPTIRMIDLVAGRLDVAELSPPQARQIEADRDVRLITFPTGEWVYAGWNLRLPIFHDARVRRALTMAIDRQELVDALLGGYAEAGRSTVTPIHWQYERNDPRTTLAFDPGEARRLLREAGWSDRDGDGIVENERGQPFRFTMKTTPARSDVLTIVQAHLRQIGVDARPQILEETTLIDQLVGNVNARGERERDFEAVISSWLNPRTKDDTEILHSRSLDEPNGDAGFSHPRADWLLDTLRLITDPDQSRPLWREYQRLIVQESPFTVLYYPEAIWGVRNRLQGVEMSAATGHFLHTAHRWWIPPRER